MTPASSTSPKTAERLYARHLTAELRDSLEAARVVNVIGPRQVGKATMVNTLFEGGRFVTLDERTIREALAADPVEGPVKE